METHCAKKLGISWAKDFQTPLGLGDSDINCPHLAPIPGAGIHDGAQFKIIPMDSHGEFLSRN